MEQTTQSREDDWDATYEPTPSGRPSFQRGEATQRRCAQAASAEAPAPAKVGVELESVAGAGDIPMEAVLPGAGGPREPIPHKRKPNHFPAFMSRSAMFRASSSSGTFEQPTKVDAQGCDLKVSGPKLGMRDKLVWEIAVQIAKERAGGLAEPYWIELRDFARRMGAKSFGGRNLASILESLTRLTRCRVEFAIDGGDSGIGCLIATVAKSGKRAYVRLNPDFARAALLCDKQFEQDHATRVKLSSALAQWLHDFYRTHSVSKDMDLKYLKGLCGYDADAKCFARKLREAMDDLVAVAPAIVSSYQIEKTGRDSGSWKLCVVLGSHKPRFERARGLPAPKVSGKGKVAL